VSEQVPAPLAVVCRVAGVSRSAACEARRRRGISEPLRRRPGPVGVMSDRELARRDLRRAAERARSWVSGIARCGASAPSWCVHEPQAGAAPEEGRGAARADRPGAQARAAAA
jgi:hypothetical protein